MNEEEHLHFLIDYLQKEANDFFPYETLSFSEKFELFRGLCNVREPIEVSDNFLLSQDKLLTHIKDNRSLTTIDQLDELSSGQYVWQGDITTLKVDAIVNAANSKLLGCLQRNHNCIDNIIHTYAGVQLRLACHQIIQNQGRKEPVGKAKITKAYHLPSTYVIHTVGPYIDKKGVTPLKESLLASSYRSSLELADNYNLSSIAFCCISTGVFNFPQEKAAQIAIDTINKYKRETQSNIKIIYNVFTDKDLHIYKALLD
ncbi:MAG TPA: protein-ADP-ribose hydrolase [Bacillota bacterium]|nr:protein-ADP-ribose hydrolase [Bacillota bacterium]